MSLSAVSGRNLRSRKGIVVSTNIVWEADRIGGIHSRAALPSRLSKNAGRCLTMIGVRFELVLFVSVQRSLEALFFAFANTKERDGACDAT